MACAHDSIKSLPAYLNKNLPLFFGDIEECVAPVVPLGFEKETTENLERLTRENGSLDHHCKTSKIKHIEKLVSSIRARIEAWLEHVKKNPSVKGLQALFTQEEILGARAYVPRCK